jgi:hypothetical protein
MLQCQFILCYFIMERFVHYLSLILITQKL